MGELSYSWCHDEYPNSCCYLYTVSRIHLEEFPSRSVRLISYIQR